VGLDPRIEEADLERVIDDRAILPDKLIEPLPVHDRKQQGLCCSFVDAHGSSRGLKAHDLETIGSPHSLILSNSVTLNDPAGVQV
jgi:hypothetical protein